MMSTLDSAKAYLVGGGIASLSAAVLLGQYVDIPEDVVFTVEYSVRGAMQGVYGLLGVKCEIPAIYHGLADPKVAFDALKTLMG